MPLGSFASIATSKEHQCLDSRAWLQAPAEGLWGGGPSTDREDIVIFEVMTDAIDLEDWRRRRADLERQFRQDKVIIRYLPIALVQSGAVRLHRPEQLRP